MGNRSVVIDQDLTPIDIEAFSKYYIAEMFTIDSMPDGDYKSILRNMRFEEGDVYLDLDGWKIFGYWYNGFVDSLKRLMAEGLRGFIKLEDDEGYSYSIYFEDDYVSYEVHGIYRFDEDGESTIFDNSVAEEKIFL